VDADAALIRAFNLGMDDAGWTEEVMDKAELLLPTLVAAGYATKDDDTWRFTEKGVTRYDEIEATRDEK
jgi:hypothetical protein